MQSDDLPNNIPDFTTLTESLFLKIKDQDSLLENKDHQISDLHSLINQMKRKIYGTSSEVVSSDQLSFQFDEADVLDAANPVEDKTDDEFEDISYSRKKRKGRRAIPEDLPREEVIIDIAEGERCCPHGHEYKKIGFEESEKLEYTPAKLKVIRTKRIKRACDCIECKAIKVAPAPPSILPKSFATASLLAFIIISKYIDHLSLYRISNIFSRIGFDLPRQTLANWMVKIGVELTPLIKLLEESLLGGDYIFCDETRVQVLKEPGKSAQSQSQMWVRARHGPQPIILFDYDPTRSGDVASRLLEGFKGHLHVDGYAGYNGPCANEYVYRVADLYHIRRKFKDAYDDAKKNKGNMEPAAEVLRFIKKLSKIENALAGSSDFDRFHMRLKKSKPVMDKMKEWLDANKDSYRPKSPIGKAITYALGQWPYMMMFLSHGKLEITTNFVENAIRPFALGRRNWLFCNSVAGANSSAKLYSIIQTAKANGLDPYRYLICILERLPLAKNIEELEALLPWNVNLKD